MARRCTRRRGDLVSCRGAEFFKVFLPHLSSRQLLIPPGFLKSFKGTIRERITLKVGSGKTWPVHVEQTREGVILGNGWPKFVSDQCLEAGDFLVFRYDKCYTFVVKIFGTNLCKKEVCNADGATPLKAVKVEEV